jgi:hypothetical protein
VVRGSTWLLLVAGVLAAGCTRHKSTRRPVQMVAMPPPSEPPHAQSSVPVGGAVTFEADEVISCEAEAPDLVRAYATKEALTILGENAGRTTLRLRLAAGDVFYLDMNVTNEPIGYHVLALGEQLALPLEGVKDVVEPSKCLRTSKSADGAQLIVLAEHPCTALVGLTMQDGTAKTTEIVVIGGERLL